MIITTSISLFTTPQWPDIPTIFMFIMWVYIATMALRIKTEVYAQTAPTQGPHYLPYHPHFYHIFWVHITTMAPHIRAEEHVQTAQTQMIRVCTIFIPPIFICYSVRLHHHTGPTHQDGSACINSADPDLNRVCTICHTTHIHVITSPQWLYI